MKSTVILFFAVLSSCEYKDIGPGVSTWGTLNVMVNDKKWGERYQGYFQTTKAIKERPEWVLPCKDQYYLIKSDIYNGSAFLRESLSFEKVPFIIGKLKIVNFVDGVCNDKDLTCYGFFNTSSDDGDVGQDNYRVLETEDNYLFFDSIDPQSLEVTGRFQVTLVIKLRSVNDPSKLPDTLRFTNGVFHTKVLN